MEEHTQARQGKAQAQRVQLRDASSFNGRVGQTKPKPEPSSGLLILYVQL